MYQNKKQLGKKGEFIAEQYLKCKGYKIICKNFYTKRGEIDIIAKKDELLSFVEVKTRTNNKYGTPASAVNSTKIKHMKTTAKIFLTLENIKNYNIRFDVIEVFIKNGKCTINHIKQIV